MLKRIFSIDPGMSGTGLLDALWDDHQQMVQLVDATVVRPRAKDPYHVRFAELQRAVRHWVGRRPPGGHVVAAILIEQPTSDWTMARRKQGDVAVLGGAWACCSVAVQHYSAEGPIHQVPSQDWVPKRTKKATYLAIVEAAHPLLRGQPEHLLSAAAFTRWWLFQQQRAGAIHGD